MLTLNEIRNVNFRKANFGGYRAEDVEAFIDEVQLSYDTLLRENAELVKKLEVLAARLEEYQGEEDSIRNALMNAQKVGDASLRDAKHKAELILKDATIKAEKIVSNAQSEILNERDIIERMQRDISEFKTRLLKLYREHLTLINSLPTDDIMRPDTKSAVESVQMLDRKATEPVYETRQPQQFPNARMPQLSAEPEPSFDEPMMPEERVPASLGGAPVNPMSAPMNPSMDAPAGQPVMPSANDASFQPMPPMPPMNARGSQRKGGFTVNIDEDNGGAAPSMPQRRSFQPQAPSFDDDMSAPAGMPVMPSVQGEPAQFGEPRVQGFDVPADDEPMGTPASLFKRRGR